MAWARREMQSNPDLQWSPAQFQSYLSKQGVVSNALVQPTIEQLIWKTSYSSSFAQES